MSARIVSIETCDVCIVMCQVLPASLALQEREVPPDHLDFRVYRVTPAFKDFKVYAEIPDLEVIQDFRVLQGSTALLAQQVTLFLYYSPSFMA